MSGYDDSVKMADLTAPTPEQVRELFGMVTMSEFTEGMRRLCEFIRDPAGPDGAR
jgi:hypothetical protein